MYKRVLLALDMEGVNFVTGEPYAGLGKGTAQWEVARKQAAAEINAAAAALFGAGAEKVHLWDNHANGGNVDPADLDERLVLLPHDHTKPRMAFAADGYDCICYQQAVHKYPNLLNHCFDQTKPNQFWVTDITYIPIPGSMLYMCAVLDLCGKVVLAWKIGSDMSSSLVTDTIREALKHEKVTGGLALHSDQGSQYTSKAYFDLTQEYHVSPSMSSPGCPYDNAAMENFFGTLKTECLYRARFSSRTEVEQLVSEYVYFYNYERISLKNGLTPVEFRGKAA